MATKLETFIKSLSKKDKNNIQYKLEDGTITAQNTCDWINNTFNCDFTKWQIKEYRQKNRIQVSAVAKPVRSSQISEYLQKANSFDKNSLYQLLDDTSVSALDVCKYLLDRGVVVSSRSVKTYRNSNRHELEKESLQEAAPQSNLVLPKKWNPGKYVVTSAQNNTPVNMPFYECVLNYCDKQNAQLVVLPIRYKNVSAMYSGSPEWDTLLTDYYLNDNIAISPSLTLKGSSRIAATASDPLSGWNTLGKESAVYGHGQFGLKTIASPKGQTAPQIFSTGSITEPNFANTKSSEIAEFNHSLGALLIEVYADGKYDYQWVSFKNNGFYCLDGFYTKDNVLPVSVDDVVLGDWHGSEAPVEHKEDAFKLVESLKPKRVWLHDVISFMSESHHLSNIDRARLILPSIQDEINELSEELARFKKISKVMVVDSNHHRHVDRWLNTMTINDNRNRLLYHKLWASVLENPSKSPFECLLFLLTGDWITNVGSEGFQSHGIELGLHGDHGANGARGSVRGFSMLSNKSITGHGHTPEWFKGAMRVGTTGPIDPGYVKGYSGMMLCHAVVYADGSRTLVSRVRAQQVKGK